jgi:hypothetical protein
MHVDGTSRHSVALPFETMPGPHNPWISMDGRRLIVAGGAPTDAAATFYDVDVASGRVTKLGFVTRPAGNGPEWPTDLLVSPDGRSTLYTMTPTPSVTFYEVDLSALLNPRGARP